MHEQLFTDMTHDNHGKIVRLLRDLRQPKYFEHLYADPSAFEIDKGADPPRGTEMPDDQHSLEMLVKALKALTHPDIIEDVLPAQTINSNIWQLVFPYTYLYRGQERPLWFIEKHTAQTTAQPKLELLVYRDDPSKSNPRQAAAERVIAKKNALLSGSDLLAPGRSRRILTRI